ncbi:MAG: tetratricopeptide repeat protein [Xanthomonadales bacterium]|nr:tetratricopeptide repeat protein [Xanthomonadales bacterium]
MFTVFAMVMSLLFADNAKSAYSKLLTTQGITAAQGALLDLPQSVQSFRAGHYLQAEQGFQGIIDKLPGLHDAATAAALLQIGSSKNYRRLLASLYTNLGLSQLRMRHYETAVISLSKAVAIDGAVAGAKVNLGLALLHQRRYPEAASTLEEALSLGGGNAKLYADLGKVYLHLGNWRKARWALVQAMRLGSKSKTDIQDWGSVLEAEKLLAQTYEAEGRLQVAEYHLNRVLKRAPGEAQARYRLIQILERQGNSTLAAQHQQYFEKHSQTMAEIQSVLATTPGEVAALHWVADSYRGLGLLHLAEVHYRQLLARYPEDDRAKLAVHKLNRRMYEVLGDREQFN